MLERRFALAGPFVLIAARDAVISLWDSSDVPTESLKSPQFKEDRRDSQEFIDGSMIIFFLAQEFEIPPF